MDQQHKAISVGVLYGYPLQVILPATLSPDEEKAELAKVDAYLARMNPTAMTTTTAPSAVVAPMKLTYGWQTPQFRPAQR